MVFLLRRMRIAIVHLAHNKNVSLRPAFFASRCRLIHHKLDAFMMKKNISGESWFTRKYSQLIVFEILVAPGKMRGEKKEIIKSNSKRSKWSFSPKNHRRRKRVKQNDFNVQPQLERINSFKSLNVASSVSFVTKTRNHRDFLLLSLERDQRCSSFPWRLSFHLPHHTNEKKKLNLKASVERYFRAVNAGANFTFVYYQSRRNDKKSKYKLDLK